MNLERFSQRDRALSIIHILRKATIGLAEPAVSQIIRSYGKDPFLILISCLLSLRAKDTVSLPVAEKLFQFAKTPQEIRDFPIDKLEKLLYSIGFYRQKARQIKGISHEILTRFDGIVPSTEKELLSIKGIGRKTANLVLGQAFDIPAICVDIHVHRITNRLGLVATDTPEQTERELQKILPKKYWTEWNRLLVMWGQNVCTPISPHCSRCALSDYCPRIGVKKSR